MPFAQSLDQIIVSWNRFLRTFSLADSDDVLHDRPCDMNLFGLEVHVSPFQREQLAPPQAGGDGQQDQLSHFHLAYCILLPARLKHGDMLTGVINLRSLVASKARLNAALPRQRSR